jgi:hypothetical protein
MPGPAYINWMLPLTVLSVVGAAAFNNYDNYKANNPHFISSQAMDYLDDWKNREENPNGWKFKVPPPPLHPTPVGHCTPTCCS